MDVVRDLLLLLGGIPPKILHLPCTFWLLVMAIRGHASIDMCIPESEVVFATLFRARLAGLCRPALVGCVYDESIQIL